MSTNERVPEEKGLDHSIALLQEGYMFIKNRRDELESDVIVTHILGQEIMCIGGEEAAKLFYDSEKFQRNGAAPKRVQRTLTGVGGVQSLDGDLHTHRKALFLSLLTPHHQKRLIELVDKQWRRAAERWETANGNVVLFEEVKGILCRASCDWAGIPLVDEEVKDRAEDFSSMVDAFGAIGPRHWKGIMARKRTEAWIKNVIEEVRAGELQAEAGTALHEMAFHRDQNGSPLDTQIAAVELINVIRPIIAVSYFITFAALTLKNQPELSDKLRTNEQAYYEMFAQEIRRFYPFTPFMGARVRKDFVWKECHFKEGMLVLLDVYGMNHDPKIWDSPNEFRPERFKEWNGGEFKFIPQGGGDPATGHRCPGEGIALEIMKHSLDFLVNKISYEVPEQDLSFSLGRIPTYPESGYIMNRIRRQ